MKVSLGRATRGPTGRAVYQEGGQVNSRRFKTAGLAAAYERAQLIMILLNFGGRCCSRRRMKHLGRLFSEMTMTKEVGGIPVRLRLSARNPSTRPIVLAAEFVI